MVVQVWITVLLVAALIVGVAWALVGRRLLERWQLETRMEEQARKAAEQERAFREKALQELQQDCYAPYAGEKTPQKQVEVQETKNE